MMRPLQLATILAFRIGGRLQGIVGTALTAARDGNFLFRYCHSFTFSSKLSGAISTSQSGRAPYRNSHTISYTAYAAPDAVPPSPYPRARPPVRRFCSTANGFAFSGPVSEPNTASASSPSAARLKLTSARLPAASSITSSASIPGTCG